MLKQVFTKLRYRLILFILLGFLCYYNALFAPFVFDDGAYVDGNSWIMSPGNLTDTTPLRYIGDLSFALNYKLFGPGPFSFHLINVIIHIVSALLVYSLISTIFKTPLFSDTAGQDSEERFFPVSSIAFITAILFLVHPINTQAVTYISQRFTSLCALFYLLALIFYLKARVHMRSEDGGGVADGKKGRSPYVTLAYFGAFASTVLAMKTKEIAATIPLVMAVLELSLFRAPWKRRLYLLAPFFATLLIIPFSLFSPNIPGYGGTNIAQLKMRHRKILDLTEFSPYKYLLTETTVIPAYIKMIFLPLNQHFDYYWPRKTTFFNGPVIASSLFLIALMAYALRTFIRAVKNKSLYPLLISFGIIWFFITISVESSIIPIMDVFNEHRIYLPGIGILLSAAGALFYLMEYLRKKFSFDLKRSSFTALAAIVLVIPLTAATSRRNWVWRDELRLYRDEVAKNPYKPDVGIYLAIAYYKRRRFDDAIKELQRILKRSPESFPALNDLASTYFASGSYDLAIVNFKAAIKLNPDEPLTYINLALAYLKKKMHPEAVKELNEALKLDPGNRRAEAFLRRIKGGKL